MATSVYLDIDQGSDFSTVITLENDDGTPMNLSTANVYSQFRKSYGSTTAYSFICEVIDAQQGKLRLSIPGITSTNIRHGRYLYDVELVYVGPTETRRTRVIEGILTINPEITKIP